MATEAPVFTLPVFAGALLEGGLNRFLALDPDFLPRLQALEGRVIAIEVPGLLSVYVLPNRHGVQLLGRYAGDVDVRLRGSVVALMSLAGSDVGALRDGTVEVEGDLELAQEFNQILARHDIDWEELLSRWVGDGPAHQMGRVWAVVARWGRQLVDDQRANVSAYVQEEAGILVSRSEADAFMDDVDQLRADADRLEARIQRLHPPSGADR